MIDIDRFKQINDSLGHEAGDYLLEEVSQRITASIKNADTIARLSSDEFAILIQYDSEETVRNRLGIYHDQTQPLVEFYKTFEKDNAATKYVHIPGVGSLEEITAKVMASLGA